MADNLPPNDNLESFFQESFKGFAEEPPDDLWDSIEANIPPPPAKKRFFLYRSWLSVAAMLLLVFGVSIFAYKVWQHEQKITDLSEQVQDDSKKIKQLNKTVDSLKGVLNESKEEQNNSSNDALTFDKQRNALANDDEKMLNNTVLNPSKKAFPDENEQVKFDKNSENDKAFKANVLPFLANEKTVEKTFKNTSKERTKNNNLRENIYSNTQTAANFNAKNSSINAEKTTQNSFSYKESKVAFENNINKKNNTKNVYNQSFMTENTLENNVFKQNKTDFHEAKQTTINNFSNNESVFLSEQKNEILAKNNFGKLQTISPLLSLKIDEIENGNLDKKLVFSDKKSDFSRCAKN